MLFLLLFPGRARTETQHPLEEREFVGIPFVRIPAGCFQMGSPITESGRDPDEGPVHEVCLDSFWMGKHEVTQGQWMVLMGRNPSHFKLGEHYPVEQVNWEDIQIFIQKLNARNEGHFRLPTEAEWEYAARAGTTTPFCFGSQIQADTQANYNGKTPYGAGPKGVFRHSTTQVGSFLANSFGLHDLHGNLSEWVQDWYCDDFYGSVEGRQKNPVCRNDASGFHLLRGGSWYDSAVNLRSADRGWSTSDNRYASIGFRLARSLE
ncbi:MAG: formylglycine-generating enzyme family protein [Magnetococcus sp. YQC-5]